MVADNLSTGYRANIPAQAHFVQMDLGNSADYARLNATTFDTVFHLAAQSSGEASFVNPWNDFNSHATATFLLLDLCRRRGVNRFLYGSSMAVYGEPQYLPVDELHRPIRRRSMPQASWPLRAMYSFIRRSALPPSSACSACTGPIRIFRTKCKVWRASTCLSSSNLSRSW